VHADTGRRLVSRGSVADDWRPLERRSLQPVELRLILEPARLNLFLIDLEVLGRPMVQAGRAQAISINIFVLENDLFQQL
jgi:hypothetical protein